MGPESNHRGGGYGPSSADLWSHESDAFDYAAWEREHMRRQRNVAIWSVVAVATVVLFTYLFFWVAL